MVDERLVEYIRTNLNKGYTLEQLKAVLIEHGYSPVDVEKAAAMALQSETPRFEKTEKPKDVKWLAVLYGISYFLTIIALFFVKIDFFSYEFIVWTISIVVIPIIILGLLRYAKWGMFLAFAFSTLHLIYGVVGLNIIKIAVHTVILYYLYKWRDAFK